MDDKETKTATTPNSVDSLPVKALDPKDAASVRGGTAPPKKKTPVVKIEGTAGESVEIRPQDLRE